MPYHTLCGISSFSGHGPILGRDAPLLSSLTPLSIFVSKTILHSLSFLSFASFDTSLRFFFRMCFTCSARSRPLCRASWPWEKHKESINPGSITPAHGAVCGCGHGGSGGAANRSFYGTQHKRQTRGSFLFGRTFSKSLFCPHFFRLDLLDRSTSSSCSSVFFCTPFSPTSRGNHKRPKARGKEELFLCPTHQQTSAFNLRLRFDLCVSRDLLHFFLLLWFVLVRGVGPAWCAALLCVASFLTLWLLRVFFASSPRTFTKVAGRPLLRSLQLPLAATSTTINNTIPLQATPLAPGGFGDTFESERNVQFGHWPPQKRKGALRKRRNIHRTPRKDRGPTSMRIERCGPVCMHA